MSFHVKKILVPTDFSTFANAAADAAIELARKFDASVTLLHVIPLSAFTVYSTGMEGVGFDTGELQKAVRAAAEKSAAAELARMVASNVPVEVVTVEGRRLRRSATSPRRTASISSSSAATDARA